MRGDRDTRAILIGLPVTIEEFLARVRDSDWLGKYRRTDLDAGRYQEWLESTWTREYEPLVASPLRALQEVAGSLAASLSTRATIADVREATAKHAVVILFAHWKGPEMTNDDLVTPVSREAFLAKAQGSESTIGAWMTDQLRSDLPGHGRKRVGWLRAIFGGSAALREPTLREILQGALHAQLDNDPGTGGVDEVIEDPLTRMARRREVLDALFAGLLQPGNRLELFDGLHAKEAVESAIAVDFTGVLDFTCCTSTHLADFISSRRRLALRTVQFPTVQDFLWGATCVKIALRLSMTDGGPGYLEARQQALKLLEHEVRHASN